MNSDLSIRKHSLQHVMVLAIRRLYGLEIALGVGPIIENGFYQDLEYSLKPEAFPSIEDEMRRIIAADIAVEREVRPIDDARAFFASRGQRFKVELLDSIKAHGTSRADKDAAAEDLELRDATLGGNVSLYSFGEHVDLCRGPHVQHTGELRNLAWKLDRVAGAYWRGSEKNPMLSRVYALAFEQQKELDLFVRNREEAIRRDHRRIGEQQELFFFHSSAPGMAYWLPKGVILKNTLIQFWREYHQARNYQEIQTPIVNKRDLWEISGHWKHYQSDMIRCDFGTEEE